MSVSSVSVEFSPAQCNFDEPVQVVVRGLASKHTVSLVAKVKDDRGMTFQSSAVYQANENGEVDLKSSPSLSGSYSGVEPMGLFSTLAPLTPHNKFSWWDASKPVPVDIEVVSPDSPDQVLVKVTHQRHFMRQGAQRIVVTEGKIRGTLFIPPGPGPFPAIVDLYTLGGGPSEARASLMCNKGFIVLGLAFYRYKDLPKQIDKLDLEYFEEGVHFLKKQPQWKKDSGVGVISISKSGDLALAMASFLPDVRAVVTVNGCCCCSIFPLHYKGTVIPILQPEIKMVTFTAEGLLDISKATPKPTTQEQLASFIPIERANSHFMFVASDDDGNWDSACFAELAAQRLRENGKENFEVVRYPTAGHFVDVPYMPFYPSGIHAAVGKVVVFGGVAKDNAQAQIDLWKRVEYFFRKHL